MITHSDSIKAISKALLAFQGAVDGVEKNKANPHFKSRYANLEAVRDTAVPELQKVGIVYVQSPGPIVDGNMSLTTMLIHPESGEWMKMTGDIALGKKDPQGVGSALTYLQRYSLMAALGLPPVDDDGEGAMERKPRAAPEQPASAFQSHYTAINTATNMKALEVAFLAAKADKNLTSAESQDIIVAKNVRKDQLSQPDGYQAPNFDNLSKDAQDQVKALRAG